MTDQKLSTLVKPPSNFLIKRIDEQPIMISREVRDRILESLARGDRFIQVGEHTIMLNSIKGIDPTTKKTPEEIEYMRKMTAEKFGLLPEKTTCTMKK